MATAAAAECNEGEADRAT